MYTLRRAWSRDFAPVFVPKLSVLPPAQRFLWTALDAVPAHLTLYGGTALALRLGHRQFVDLNRLPPLAAAAKRPKDNGHTP